MDLMALTEDLKSKMERMEEMNANDIKLVS